MSDCSSMLAHMGSAIIKPAGIIKHCRQQDESDPYANLGTLEDPADSGE